MVNWYKLFSSGCSLVSYPCPPEWTTQVACTSGVEKTIENGQGCGFGDAVDICGIKKAPFFGALFCGVIAFIILSGYPPFNGADHKEIMDKVKIGLFNF